MTLVEQMVQEQLAVEFTLWPDSPYKTLKARTNAQAAEVATKVAEEFYRGLVGSAHGLLDALATDNPALAIQATKLLQQALLEVNSPRPPVLVVTEAA